MTDSKRLQLYETIVLLNQVAVASESGDKHLRMLSGSRILVTLHVEQIDPSTQVSIMLQDTFSPDVPYDTIDTMSSTAVGAIKRIYSDFNSYLRFAYTLSGPGGASFKLSVKLFDNASNTRIDNAQVAVDLDHVPDVLGHYDSLRIGDGVEELAINTDNEALVHDQDTHDRLDTIDTILQTEFDETQDELEEMERDIEFQSLIALLSTTKFLALGNPDFIEPSVVGDTTTIDYQEDGAIIGRADLRFVDSSDWDITLQAFLNDDDGSILLDDDGSNFLVE